MRGIFVIVCCFFILQSFGQRISPDDYDCPRSSYKHSEWFIKDMEANQMDSAYAILESWFDKCSYREVNLRAQFLWMAKQNQVNEYNIPDDMVGMLFHFIQRDTLEGLDAKLTYEYNPPHFAYIPIGEHFDQFTKQQFRRLERLANNPQINLIYDIYSGLVTNLEEKLMQPEFQGSQLWSQWQALQTKHPYYGKKGTLNFLLYAGIWKPLDANSHFGVHPELGFELGWKRNKLSYNFNFGFKFLNSKEAYLARRNDNDVFEKTKHFFGGVFTFDLGYPILNKRKNQLEIITGAGIDGIDLFKEEDDENNTASIVSYNFGLGIKYKYQISKEKYIGLRVRHNFVDYTLGNKINFNVAPISIGFIYGGSTFFSNSYRY